MLGNSYCYCFEGKFHLAGSSDFEMILFNYLSRALFFNSTFLENQCLFLLLSAAGTLNSGDFLLKILFDFFHYISLLNYPITFNFNDQKPDNLISNMMAKSDLS
jgi:hypothetical protein